MKRSGRLHEPAVTTPPPFSDRGSALSSGSRKERFALLYREYDLFVWRTLRRFGLKGAGLDDGMQDVFVVAHQKLDDFDGASPRAWLAAIARRVAADTRRRNTKHQVCAQESQHELAVTTESLKRCKDQSSREAAVELVHSLLGCLDDEKREVFVLAELEGLSMKEVADVTEINVNTAYSRLRAARLNMKAEYARVVAREKWRQP